MSEASKATLISVIHVIAAILIYRYLISGGWLTNQYHLNDPNLVNLVLAIFEPLAIISVIAFWIRRKRAFYRLMCALCVVQVLVGVGFAVFVIFFALTWQPKLM